MFRVLSLSELERVYYKVKVGTLVEADRLVWMKVGPNQWVSRADGCETVADTYVAQLVVGELHNR